MSGQKEYPLPWGQGETEEEEIKSEAPLTLPHGFFATLAVLGCLFVGVTRRVHPV